MQILEQRLAPDHQFVILAHGQLDRLRRERERVLKTSANGG
jgi:hypothetical protein